MSSGVRVRYQLLNNLVGWAVYFPVLTSNVGATAADSEGRNYDVAQKDGLSAKAAR